MSARISLLAAAAKLQSQSWAESIAAAFRALAGEAHPDHGGSDAGMRDLNAARDRLMPKPAKAESSTKPKEPVPPPRAADILRVEERRSTWGIVTEASLETVLDPMWLGPAIKTKGMRALDRLDVTHAKGEYIVELLITAIDAEAQALAYKAIRIVDLTGAPEIGPDWETATVAHEGEQQKWAVRLGGRIARAGWETEGLAQAYLSAKRMARAGA